MAGRPRGYVTADVVRAAREVFWERGYEATSLVDLEKRTGLSRSSIYQVFGSKQGLFDAVLHSYLREVAQPRLVALQRPDAGLAEVVAYLNTLSDMLRPGMPLAVRGCLVVNTITELGGRDSGVGEVGRQYLDRLVAALANALSSAAARCEIDPRTAAARARILAAVVIGALVSVRLDPGEAADLARAAAREVTGWAAGQRPPASGDDVRS